MQRYFGFIKNNKAFLNEEDTHHLKVLRTKIGECIEVVDSAKLYECQVDGLSPLDITVISEITVDNELPKEVTLFFSLSKGDKNEFVIQKATELGVSRIVLLDSIRTVMKIKKEDEKRKLERYQKIAKEASEQSHRLVVPKVEGVYQLNKLDKSLLPELSFVAYEKEAGKTTNSFLGLEKASSIGIFIGPEGGYEEKEIDFLSSLGVKAISLGKRILRCETSAVYALSVIGYLLEK